MVRFPKLSYDVCPVIPSPNFVGVGTFGLSVCPSIRHTLGGLSCVRFSSKATKLWVLKPVLIYSWHIIVVHLVFSLFENLFIWSQLRSKPRQFWVHEGLPNQVLCVFLFQRSKATDYKSYADLHLIYCSCAPCIQSVRKFIYLVKIEVKTFFEYMKACWTKPCVRFSSKEITIWILKPMLIYSLHVGVVHLVFSLSENSFIRSDLRSKLVCASPLKGKCYRFRILRGFTPEIL